MHQVRCMQRSSLSLAPSASLCFKSGGSPLWTLNCGGRNVVRSPAWPVQPCQITSLQFGPLRGVDKPGRSLDGQPFATGLAWDDSSGQAAAGVVAMPGHHGIAIIAVGVEPCALRLMCQHHTRRLSQRFGDAVQQQPQGGSLAVGRSTRHGLRRTTRTRQWSQRGYRPSDVRRLVSAHALGPVHIMTRRHARGWAHLCRALSEGSAASGRDDLGQGRGDDEGARGMASGVDGNDGSSAAGGNGGVMRVDGAGGGDDAPVYLGYIFLDNGQVLRTPRQRAELWPRHDFTWQECLAVQLQALQNNNVPSPDHGIEVLYRFADFNPFVRSKYFGRSLDLGQFERFRRVMHSPPYDTLLNHEAADLSSCLQLSETRWRQRVRIRPLDATQGHTFDFTLVQRVGGQYDGPKASLQGGAVFICPAKMRAKWRKKRMRRLKRKRRKMRQRSK